MALLRPTLCALASALLACASSSPSGIPDAGDAGSPQIAGCPIFPADHLFNTRIDGLPPSGSSGAFMTTIGVHRLHLDLGTETDPQQSDYYGIPYNVVHGASQTWASANFHSADSSLDWDPRAESDCAIGSAHTFVSPCTAAAAPQPVFPIPASPLVEGGIDSDPSQPYGDHHILLLDADACQLWELYHSYPAPSGGWDIFGAASFDLRSNALRPDGWTSADAAGFSMPALLLRADEASSGTIAHALRMTIPSSQIRAAHVWPARHDTGQATSMSLPPMGQLFRLKSGFTIPDGFGTQSRAILRALQLYGVYLADGGSSMYLTGEPSAAWDDRTFTEVQSIDSSQFEAVDLAPIEQRAGFDASSARVPP